MASSCGSQHAVNEDAHSALDGSGKLFVVADGVGGGAMAQTASRMLVALLHDALEAHAIDAARVAAAMLGADRAIAEAIARVTDRPGAATVAMCAPVDAFAARWLVAWVGDCRVYRWSPRDDGRLDLLTRDDTFGALGEAVPAGGSPTDPARMVGNGATTGANAALHALGRGELLAICSDGVHKHLDDADWCRVLGADVPLGRAQRRAGGARARPRQRRRRDRAADASHRPRLARPAPERPPRRCRRERKERAMSPADIDRVFGRGRLRMVTGDHVEVFREASLPGERRRYTKRFLATAAGDFSEWTEREWRILARLVGHGIKPVPDVVRFDRGAADHAGLVQTYDAGVTVDHWATLLPVARDGVVLRNVFEDCAHWWALARHSLIALDAIHELRLVHLDLKADNVCIPFGPEEFDPCTPGATMRPRFDDIALIDFAFSLVSGERLVSPLPIAPQADYEYQSPRLLRALAAGRDGDLAPTRQLDWRCDLFSLAAMLWRYLPELEDTATGEWTRPRHARARALVRRLIEAHDAELPATRPHAEFIALAADALDAADLRASLQRGWTLALAGSGAAVVAPTPVTRIAQPVATATATAAASAAPPTPITVPVAALGSTATATSPSRSASASATSTTTATSTTSAPSTTAPFGSMSDSEHASSDVAGSVRLDDDDVGTPPLAADPSEVVERMQARGRERERRLRRILWGGGAATAALTALAMVAWLTPSWLAGERGDLPVSLAGTAQAPAPRVASIGSPPAPGPTSVVPGSTSAVPGSTSAVPGSTPALPDSTSAVPSSTSPAPDSASTSPRPTSDDTIARPADPDVAASHRELPAAAPSAPTNETAAAPQIATTAAIASRPDAAAAKAAPRSTRTPAHANAPVATAAARPLRPATPATSARERSTAPAFAKASSGRAPRSGSVTAFARLAGPATPRSASGDRPRPFLPARLAAASTQAPSRPAAFGHHDAIPWAVAGRPAPHLVALRSGGGRAVPSTSAVAAAATRSTALPAGSAGEMQPPGAAAAPTALAVVARPSLASDADAASADGQRPRPPSAGEAAAPLDYAARATDLMTNDVPRLAQRAERQVARVLFLAGRSDRVVGDGAIRAAAGAVGRDAGDGLAALPVSTRDAQRLGEAARAEYGRRGGTAEALTLQARAFGANPLDADAVGNLAFLLLRQQPAQPEAARQLALHALTLHGPGHAEGRIEDWATFAIASALAGRERDARNAFLVTLALAPDLERHCQAALDVYALYGERLRAPVQAMLASANAETGSSGACEWPSHWMVSGAR